MEVQWSAGSNLLFMVGTLEAALGPYRELTPEHLFLAVCKVCDLDDGELEQLAGAAKVAVDEARAESRELVQFMAQARVNAKKTRRELRRLLQRTGPRRQV